MRPAAERHIANVMSPCIRGSSASFEELLSSPLATGGPLPEVPDNGAVRTSFNIIMTITWVSHVGMTLGQFDSHMGCMGINYFKCRPFMGLESANSTQRNQLYRIVCLWCIAFLRASYAILPRRPSLACSCASMSHR